MEKSKLLSAQMAELSITAQYRKVISEMKKLQRNFSDKRFVYVTNPNKTTIDLLKNEGFILEQTGIKEYNQFKVSW